MEDQRRDDTQGISGRVQRELAEAETRLGKQNARLATLQRQLHKQLTTAEPSEQANLDEAGPHNACRDRVAVMLLASQLGCERAVHIELAFLRVGWQEDLGL